jgi:hypothetical protein
VGKLQLNRGLSNDSQALPPHLPPRHWDDKSTPSTHNMIVPQCAESTIQYPESDTNAIPRKIHKQKKKHTSIPIYITTNNINGLKIKSNPKRTENIIKFMYNQGADILLLQELNMNMQHPDTKKHFQPISAI